MNGGSSWGNVRKWGWGAKNNSSLEEMFVCDGWKWNYPTAQHIGYDSFFH